MNYSDYSSIISDAFGKNSYKASRSFFDWLYYYNPYSTSLDVTALVEKSDGKKIACINLILLEWNIGGEIFILPSLTDLYIDVNSRRGLFSIKFIQNSLSKFKYAFVNGSNINSAPIFRFLKMKEINDIRWFKVCINKFGSGIRYLQTKIGIDKFNDLDKKGLEQNFDNDCILHSDPPDELIHELVDFFNSSDDHVKVQWTFESLRWRFYHNLGPRHFTIVSRNDIGRIDSAIIASIGQVQCFNVSRIVLTRYTNNSKFISLLNSLVQHLRANGVHFFMMFTQHDSVANFLMNIGGIETIEKKPATFFYSNEKASYSHFNNVKIFGGYSDYGFDFDSI